MLETVRKYMIELGDSDAEELVWKYLFTSNLKILSGAVLHKTVFSFRLAYIKELEKKLGIKLPILLDSPKGKEIDDSNVQKMMSIPLFRLLRKISAQMYRRVWNGITP